MALSGLALAHAMLGDARAAAEVLREREAVPEFGFLAPEQQLADAWTAVSSRQPVQAAELLRAAASQAGSTMHLVAESWLLHDLVRACRQDTSARLSELAAACDSPLVAARARHAVAARTGDARELAGAADDFEALGAMLLAAEAAVGAAEAWSRAGERRAAAAALRRSEALAKVCEGARTPALFHAAAHEPLSGRERDVAMLAAEGRSSKDIAERLHLSVRTVDNHLQRAFSKLGVTSRADLARKLGTSS